LDARTSLTIGNVLASIFVDCRRGLDVRGAKTRGAPTVLTTRIVAVEGTNACPSCDSNAIATTSCIESFMASNGAAVNRDQPEAR
jgi:hypothetical protein